MSDRISSMGLKSQGAKKNMQDMWSCYMKIIWEHLKHWINTKYGHGIYKVTTSPSHLYDVPSVIVSTTESSTGDFTDESANPSVL